MGKTPRWHDPFKFLAIAGIVLMALAMLAGCGTFQPTAGQSDKFETSQRGIKLTAEELSALPVLVDDTITTNYDGEGRVVSVVERSTQRGYPTAIAAQRTKTSGNFTDSEFGLGQTSSNAGTDLTIGRGTRGNPETLEQTTTAQVQRAEIESQMAGAIVAGAVKAAIEAVVPVKLSQEAGRTERRRIEADRDVRLKELEPEPVHEEPAEESPAAPTPGTDGAE